MRPVIGISCSTLVLTGMRGVPRFALSEQYVRCVVEAGGLPLLLPNIEGELAPMYLSRLDGLVFSGGLDVDPCYFGEEPHAKLGQIDQRRDEFELSLVRDAHAAGIPTLCICRGAQVLNVAFGGTLIQDIRSEIPAAYKHEQQALRQDALTHHVDVVEGTRLREIAGAERVRVNTFHHQSVKAVADGFRVNARAGDGVIEGIEDPEHVFCVGVQWHPERVPQDAVTQGLFQGVVEAARRAAQPRAP